MTEDPTDDPVTKNCRLDSTNVDPKKTLDSLRPLQRTSSLRNLKRTLSLRTLKILKNPINFYTKNRFVFLVIE